MLYMLALNINDVINFDYMDHPSLESMINALEQLYLLGAIHKTDKLQLTQLGDHMSRLPLPPQLSTVLLTSKRLMCGQEILTIVSMLSTDNVLFTPHHKKEQANAMRNKLISLDGDHMMLVNIYKAYKGAKGNKEWCNSHFISKQNMKKAIAVRDQLQQICTSKLQLSFCHTDNSDSIR